jgi:hypothetical protein
MKIKTKLSQEERFTKFVQLVILAKYPNIIASTRVIFVSNYIALELFA